MKKSLANNWGLKLFALAAAVCLWLVVVNDNDPLIPHWVNNVPVTVINDEVFSENDMTYKITSGTTVNIKVMVRQTASSVLKASDFKLTADCSNWHPGFATIPIETEIVNNKTYYSSGNYTLSTAFIKIEVEELKSKTLPVEIKTVGVPAEGYTLGATVCSPTQIEIKAPESVAKILSEAAVSLNIKGAMGDVQEICDLKLYDGNGEEVFPEEAKVTMSDTSVNVSAEILKTKSVPVVVTNVTGVPSQGYRYTGTTCSIQNVQIAGPKASVGNVDSVILDSALLDVSGATANVYVSLDISEFLPEDVSVVGEAGSTVEIEMTVEQLAEKTVSVSSGEISFAGGADSLDYRLGGDITFTLLGLAEDLASLDLASLNPTVDVSGAEIGENVLPLSLELGNVYEVHEPLTVKVEVSEKEPDRQANPEEDSDSHTTQYDDIQ